MARRLDIELTSSREDGTWTWRAAGAKLPRGEVSGELLPDGASVGDVIKVEAEIHLDGVDITAVFAPKAERREPERLELLGSGDDAPLVTSHLVSKRRRDDRDDRNRGGGRERRGGRRRDERGQRDDRKGRDGRDRDGSRQKRERRERSKPARPKAKRLRPGRTHRQAALKDLPESHRALADEVLRGGVPGVRQAIEHMNTKARSEGMPAINSEPLVRLAERLAPDLKAAEWRDRADAALAGLGEVDLRDIRSVVVAADSAARDDESKELAERLRTGLAERVDAEHKKWLRELAETIESGRTVRALRLSSRPPKAGSPLPPDMAERLAAAASAGLDSDTGSDRWATVVDAVAYSPVRAQVRPAGLPAKPSDELLSAVRKLASRVPQIAEALGVEVPAPRKGRGRRPAPPPPPPVPDSGAAGETPSPTPPVAEPAPEAAAKPEPAAEPAPEAASGESAAVEAGATGSDDGPEEGAT